MNLPFGKSTVPLPDLWDGRAFWIEPGPFRTADGREIVETALDNPKGTPLLSDGVIPGERIACVIPDLTRRAAVEVYLPVLTSRLLSAGVSPDDMDIVVALGIHRSLDDDELRKLVGEEVWGKFRIINHDPDAKDGNIDLGVTGGKIPVQINRLVAEADKVILTGGITYHYFAGYGGGRKSFLPGVASRLSCETHHRLVVSWRRKELSGSMAPGVLEGNPVQDEMLQACSFAPPIFTLNVVTDPQGKIVGACSGDLQTAHLEACRMHDVFYKREIPGQFKLVIASAGGYPKDVNFVQAHKGLYSAHLPVEKGGVVVLLAQCPEGAGNRDLFSWFTRCQTEEDWLRELDMDYQINAQTAFSTWLRVRRSHTILVSLLNPAEVRKMGMIPADSMEEALTEAEAILGQLPVPIILPDAADTLTVIKKSRVQGSESRENHV
jgi:nickel-dependent lactate racemase